MPLDEPEIVQSLRQMTRQLRQDYLYLLIHDTCPMYQSLEDINRHYCYGLREETLFALVLHVSPKLAGTPVDAAWLADGDAFLRRQLAQIPGDAETLRYSGSNICCIIGSSWRYGEVLEHLTDTFRQLKMLPGMYTCAWTMGIGRLAGSISELHESLFSAQHALKYSITLGTGQIFDGNDRFGIFEGGLSLLHSSDELAMKQTVLRLQPGEVERCIRGLFAQRWEQIQSYPVYAFMLSLQILQISLQALRERMPIDRKTYELEQAYEGIIDQQDTLDRLIQCVVDGTLALCERYRQFTEQGHSRPIWLAVTYIQEHYTERIRLDTLAALADRNPQYLSTAFSREVGMSVTDYIASLRMEQAKELLVSTGATIGEIGAKVGYDDPKYFSRMFLKQTGESPQSFRRRHRQDAGKTVETPVITETTFRNRKSMVR